MTESESPGQNEAGWLTVFEHKAGPLGNGRESIRSWAVNGKKLA